MTPAQTLGSWVRIPLEPLTSIFSLCVVLCVCRGFAMGRPPVQGVLSTVCKVHNFAINSEWEQAKEKNPFK
jgi:hypothetical protein